MQYRIIPISISIPIINPQKKDISQYVVTLLEATVDFV